LEAAIDGCAAASAASVPRNEGKTPAFAARSTTAIAHTNSLIFLASVCVLIGWFYYHRFSAAEQRKVRLTRRRHLLLDLLEQGDEYRRVR
jgi:hypothetical protein